MVRNYLKIAWRNLIHNKVFSTINLLGLSMGMEVESYLKRINFDLPQERGLNTLSQLHQAHLFAVPFEDLDIHLGIPINLDPQAIYDKVVNRCRGGFCYELNALFGQLLRHLGYAAVTINAQIINEGEAGPPYDHMAVVVDLGDMNWLVDVGHGDLFIRPVAIEPDVVQFDGFNYFRVKQLASQTYSLGMAADPANFEEKYIFQLNEAPIECFGELCQQKQQEATSYFVRNLVCTKPTSTGRKTVFNDKLVIREGDQKTTTLLTDKAALFEVLHREFNINLYQERLAGNPDTAVDSPGMARLSLN